MAKPSGPGTVDGAVRRRGWHPAAARSREVRSPDERLDDPDRIALAHAVVHARGWQHRPPPALVRDEALHPAVPMP